MEFYHKEKENHSPNLTQIVGLSASPYLNKAKNLQDASKAIMTLCSQLDIEKIPVIKDNKKDLENVCYDTDIEFFEVPPRENSEFFIEISTLMNDIELNWKDKIGKNKFFP